jgi:hypothetical protein
MDTSASSDPGEQFKALVVAAILDSNPERALDMLCGHYNVDKPKLGVGVISGRSKGVLAVYSAKRKEILAINSQYLFDPFTILHEFYHHLRYFDSKHRGTERYADRFAKDYILAYKAVTQRVLAERAKGTID